MMTPEDYKKWTEMGFVVDYETGQVLGTSIPQGKYGDDTKTMHTEYKRLEGEKDGDHLEAAKLRYEVTNKLKWEHIKKDNSYESQWKAFDPGHVGSLNYALYRATNGEMGWTLDQAKQFKKDMHEDRPKNYLDWGNPFPKVSQQEVDSYIQAEEAKRKKLMQQQLNSYQSSGYNQSNRDNIF